MNHTLPTDDLLRRETRRNRIFLLAAAAAAFAVAALALLFDHDRSIEPGASDASHLVIVGVWVVIAAAFLVRRYWPRSPYDQEATMRPRSERFQGKRWRLLLLISTFVGVVLTPLAMVESLRPIATGSVADRLYFAVMMLGPCGLLVGVMTGGAYSRAVGAAVDDELTDAHRASAFKAGFIVFTLTGFAAYLVALFQSTWAIACLQAVLGLTLAAAGARFALLERAAGLDD
jgi:hypothetical protein